MCKAVGQWVGMVAHHTELVEQVARVTAALSSTRRILGGRWRRAIDVQIKNENPQAISTLSHLPDSLKHYLTSYSGRRVPVEDHDEEGGPRSSHAPAVTSQ